MKVEVSSNGNLPGMLIVRPENAAERLMLRSFGNHQGAVEVGTMLNSDREVSLTISRRCVEPPKQPPVGIVVLNQGETFFKLLKIGTKFRHATTEDGVYFIKETETAAIRVSGIIPGLGRCYEIVNADPMAIVEVVK